MLSTGEENCKVGGKFPAGVNSPLVNVKILISESLNLTFGQTKKKGGKQLDEGSSISDPEFHI